MKIARFKNKAQVALGIVEGDEIISLCPSEPSGEDSFGALLAVLASGNSPMSAGWRRGISFALGQVKLLAPVARPGKIIGIGRNYFDHASEMAVETPEVPKVFFKWPGSVIGPNDTIQQTEAIKQLDHEVEIGVVIGKQCRNVSRIQAARHIAGLTIVNDVSDRALQMMPKAGSTSLAKSLDTFCPMGPWLVTLDEIGDFTDLTLECFINGQQVQFGSTAQMIFPIPVLIEYLSRYITLEPGDVIATGTPSGVGMYRVPQTWMKPGDTVTLRVSQIGTLENHVVFSD